MRPRILQGRARLNDGAGPGERGPAHGSLADQARRRLRRRSRQTSSASVEASSRSPGVEVAGASSTVNALGAIVSETDGETTSLYEYDPTCRVIFGRSDSGVPEGVVSL